MKNNDFLDKLDKLIPQPKCELEYSSPYELLSAQCTDKRVVIVTRELFKEYNTPQKMLSLRQEELEAKIHSCGFYHNKAKSILSLSKDLLERFDGQVPNDLDKLQTLAGVGRKTANVVYAEAFKGNAIAVDTHVLRVSNRLGFVKTDNPYICEKALMEMFDKSVWGKLHLQLVLFGRYTCKSQKPLCSECPFVDRCEHIKHNKRHEV